MYGHDDMITAVGLSNKYLNRPICFEMLVL